MTAIIVHAEWALALLASVWLVRSTVLASLAFRAQQRSREADDVLGAHLKELERKVEGLVLERLGR